MNDPVVPPGLQFLGQRHPLYTSDCNDWLEWRLAYKADKYFIQRFLKRNEKHEDDHQFYFRKEMSYCPAMAKSLINEIKNSMYQRLSEISRKGGSKTYEAACQGDLLGVDRLGKSMNTFIGREVLEELLVIGRVGIYEDMPSIKTGSSVLETKNARPYFYMYKVEDILNWIPDDSISPNDFKSVLLRDNSFQLNTAGFPTGATTRFRHIYTDPDGLIHIDTYTSDYKPETNSILSPQIKKIPFVMPTISDSLMQNISRYQIALLNLSSSDISFLYKANFPLYIEQWEGRADETAYQKPTGPKDPSMAETSRTKTIEVSSGRRYGKGMEAPSFINPSPEPLQASMTKQAAMYQEMRLILNLTLANIQPTMASAESKQMDSEGLESGLNTISIELQQTERKLSEFWVMYEGSGNIATVNYPTYSIMDQESRDARLDTLTKNYNIIPSTTYKKSALKEMSRLLLSDQLSIEDLNKIYNEIDRATCLISDPAVLSECAIAGMVDLQTASTAAGFPPEAVEQAAKDHAARLARIAQAQTPKGEPGSLSNIQGVTTDSQQNLESKAESQDPTTDPNTLKKKTRGEAA
jgi:hypothetical protein